MSQDIINNIKKDGIDSILIISDFDATLTKGIDENGNVASNSFSVFRNHGFLGEDYVKKAKAEADYYLPLEHDPTIPNEKKEILMQEWWEKHMGSLLIKSGLNTQIVNKIIEDELLEPREKLKEFLHLIEELNIPLFILTAGMGDIITEFLKKINGTNKNIHIVGNFYEYNKEGFAIGLKGEIIHSLNKDLHNAKKFPFFNEISKRKNIILLGDNPNDIKMATGFEYSNILKIGFLNKLKTNDKYSETVKAFEENYDITLDWTKGMEPIIEILEKIKKQ